MQAAWTRDGRPVDATTMPGTKWGSAEADHTALRLRDALLQSTGSTQNQHQRPAVLRSSIELV